MSQTSEMDIVKNHIHRISPVTLAKHPVMEFAEKEAIALSVVLIELIADSIDAPLVKIGKSQSE